MNNPNSPKKFSLTKVFAAAAVGIVYLVRERGLRLRFDRGVYVTWAGDQRERARENLAADESAVPRG